MKRTVNAVVFALFAATVAPMLGPSRAEAYSDVSAMTDQSFFGAWNGSTWTTAGKLDYSMPGLSGVEDAVKAADYPRASAALLSYMRARTSRSVPTTTTTTTPQTQLSAELAADNVLSGSTGEYPISTMTFPQGDTPSAVTTDVTPGVLDAVNQSKRLGLMLLGRYRGSNTATLNSRTGATPPRLRITKTDGSYTDFTPVADTYIRGGAYAATNYGSSGTIEVREDGVPTTDDERRGYVAFDFGALDGTVQSATLTLTGSASTAPMPVIVYKSLIADEAATTWNSVLGTTYSWQGEPGGTDWSRPANADAEYAYIITRFGFAANMVAEYKQTGDETYAAALIRQMLDFIADRGNASALYPRSLDGALRLTAWVQAYHAIKGSASLDAAANTAVVKYIWQMADALTLTSNYHPLINWGTFENQGLYFAAEYLPEFSTAAAWRSLAINRLNGQLDTLLLPDRSYAEASSFYSTGELATITSFQQMAVANGDSLGAAFEAQLYGLARYVVDISLPNGRDPQVGDGDYVPNPQAAVRDVGALAHGSSDLDDLVYFGSGGTQGKAPTHTSTVYPYQQYATMRTGWTPDDWYLGIDNNSGNHEQPDLLSVSAYAYGRPLLVNPGRYSYTNDPVSNWLRKTTQSHNTVEVDGAAQPLLNGAGGGRVIRDWASNDVFDYFEGSQGAYPGVTQARDVFFLRKSFWLVSDVMRPTDAAAHSYDQTWHPSADSTVKLDTSTGSVTATTDTTTLQVVPADPASMTRSLKDGYYSPRLNVFNTTTYASFRKTNVTGDTAYDTLVAPSRSSSPADATVARLSITPSVPTTTASALRLGLGATSGAYYVSHEANPTATRTFGDYQFNGKMAYVEPGTQPMRLVQTAAIASGSLLKWGKRDLISSPTVVHDLGLRWDWDASTLQISGSRLVPNTGASRAVAIYAPDITTVKLNGVSVPFTRSGNYIYAAAAAGPEATRLYAATGYNTAVKLNWVRQVGVSGYLVDYGTSPGQYTATIDAGNTDMIAVTGLANGKTYYFTVRAYDSAGPGARSNEISATTVATPTSVLPAAMDATVRDGDYADTNYGTGSVLETKKSGTGFNRESYLTFDLSDIYGPVDSAKIRLVPTTVGTSTGITNVADLVLDSGWDERTITWNNRPPSSTTISSWTAPTVGTPITIDVTTQVRAALSSGAGRLSIRVYSPQDLGSGGNVAYGSKENATSANRPSLTLTQP